MTTRDEIFLRGLHNVENVLASFAAGLACGASPDSMRETVKNFKGVEHRIEFVAEIEGVKFYNDSKATSVDATLKALEALSEEDGKTVLILGGRGKNAPYAAACRFDRKNGSQAGFDRRRRGQYRIAVEKSRGNRSRRFDGGRGEKSFENAETGDAVLLAPACASFDMFKSFEERGKVFKKEVVEIVQSRRKS